MKLLSVHLQGLFVFFCLIVSYILFFGAWSVFFVFFKKTKHLKITFSFSFIAKQSSTRLNLKRKVTHSHHSSCTPTSLVQWSEYLYFRERLKLIASLFAPSFIFLSELFTNSGETIIFCLFLPVLQRTQRWKGQTRREAVWRLLENV